MYRGHRPGPPWSPDPPKIGRDRPRSAAIGRDRPRRGRSYSRAKMAIICPLCPAPATSLLQGLCCRGYAAGAVLQGLCCKGNAAGAVLQGLCCTGYAAGAMLQGLCCSGYAAGAMQQGLYAAGATLLGLCCSGYAAGTMLQGLCYRCYAAGAMLQGLPCKLCCSGCAALAIADGGDGLFTVGTGIFTGDAEVLGCGDRFPAGISKNSGEVRISSACAAPSTARVAPRPPSGDVGTEVIAGPTDLSPGFTLCDAIPSSGRAGGI